MADLKISELPIVQVAPDDAPLAIVVGGVTSQIEKSKYLGRVGFNPVSIGVQQVQTLNGLWVVTTIAIPAAVNWFLLRVDLPIARGLYAVMAAQWRLLPIVAAGDDVTFDNTINQTRATFFGTSYSFGIGRAVGNVLAVKYDAGEATTPAFTVEAFRL